MIKAGIIGTTGYVGAELYRLLLLHPEVEIVWAGSKSYEGQKYAGIYRNFYTLSEAELKGDDLAEMAGQCDVIFTATPQGYLSKNISRDMLEAAKFIDLSADFRIRDIGVYEQWYQLSHGAPALMEEAALRAADACICYISEGADAAMTRYNQK